MSSFNIYSNMPSDNMDDIELKNIQLQYPLARTLSKDTTSLLMQVSSIDAVMQV